MDDKNQRDILQITVEKEEGARLDVALSLALQDASRSYLQKLIQQGCVTLNGKVCTVKRQEVKPGDVIQIALPPAVDLEVLPEEIPLDVVYEDEDLLVVNKPRGLVVHPAPGSEKGTLVNALLYHCGDSLSSINGVKRPGIVHRIDKDTSGLLVVAKSDRAHRGLAEQLAIHAMTRKYKAIVMDNVKAEEGTIDAPLGRDPHMRLRQAVKRGDESDARRAVTHYKVLERFGRYTYLQAQLETGRTHQIRVHMAYIHHPLVGDEVYGRSKNEFGVKGQLLHAGVLGFVHPVSGEYMEFSVEPPEEFQRVLQRLRMKKTSQ